MIEEWKEFYNIKVSNYGRVETKYKGIHYGSTISNGYKVVRVVIDDKYKNFKVHRVVAHLFLGLNIEDIKVQVNHKDCDRCNNIISNLELVSHRENQQRTKKHIDGKLVGASYYKSNSKWRSLIYHNGKTKHLGYFDSELEAHQRYLEELKKI